MENKIVNCNGIEISNKNKICLIAGPCQLETEQHAMDMAGEIKNITEFGLFLGLSGDIDGMIHLSDLSWELDGEEASKKYEKGQMIQARILDVDVEKERISLGVKQLSEDPFAAAIEGIKKGETITCTVSSVTEGGLEVTVSGVLKGFIRRAGLSRERSEQRPDRYAIGDRIDARVTNVDKRDRKISLSVKAHEVAEEKQAMADYGSSDSGASLGDILGAALNRAREDEASPEDVAQSDGEASKLKSGVTPEVPTDATEPSITETTEEKGHNDDEALEEGKE